MSKHTPLPWRADLEGKGGWVMGPQSEPSGAFVICWRPPWEARSDESDANAEFIVRACNNHEKLLEALKEIVADASCSAYAAQVADAAIVKAEGR
jgi:hypothetical protein